MSDWFMLLAGLCVIGCAVLGGVFLAFSDFIMRSLAKTPGPGGAQAMNSINREVFRYVFIPMFLAMTPVLIGLAVLAWMQTGKPALYIAAALVYGLSVFGVTVVRNVPMNNALAALDETSSEGAAYWNGTYLPDWTFWNSVRTVGCVLASAILLYALVVG